MRTALESSATAVSAIWLCSALIAVLAPDMVTGSQQEHLPIASLTVWVWTATATAYVLMAALVAPPVGAITTGFLALHHAGRRD